MASVTEWKPYNLPRDKTESQRLNLQHKVYIANAGFLLHPRIAATLSEKAHIAEIATGTGIWLRDLAAVSPPSWTYTGFDISDAQFPPEGERGASRLALLNILEDTPQQYKGQFDVVHIRLLVCGLSGAKAWATAAKNIFDLLKPGGWVQWHESNFQEFQFLQTVPKEFPSANEEMKAYALEMAAKDGKVVDDVLHLDQTLESVGFEDCSKHVFSSDRVAETREATNDIQHGALVSLARFYSSTSEDAKQRGWTPEKIDELAARGRKELEDGKAYARWDMHLITARKPVR